MGSGKSGAGAPPPPPAAPPPAPTQVDASRVAATRGGPAAGRTTPENIRNEGGGRGVNVVGSTARALKSLTGQ